MAKERDVVERFWEKVDTGNPNECWTWKAGKDGDGYGWFKGTLHGQREYKAHRFSYLLFKGPIPEGMGVLHTCDNPSCVNPRHLYVGTHYDNMQDKISRGRDNTPRGEKHYSARFTEGQIIAILKDGRSYKEVAETFGTSSSTVGNIKNKRVWKHINVDSVRGKPNFGKGRRGKSDNITPDIVRTIRRSIESGKVLAERYHVSQQLICDIRKGRAWIHVD